MRAEYKTVTGLIMKKAFDDKQNNVSARAIPWFFVANLEFLLFSC